MPMPDGGFDQCYNAQVVVAAGSLLVVADNVVQAPNDKQQLEPAAPGLLIVGVSASTCVRDSPAKATPAPLAMSVQLSAHQHGSHSGRR
jgi:hypothetical protein